jgi:hypothetical protein
VLYRLSGTGSSGATIRLYIEQYTDDKARLKEDAQKALADIIKVGGYVVLGMTHRCMMQRCACMAVTLLELDSPKGSTECVHAAWYRGSVLHSCWVGPPPR